jgi:hypothetical protein
MGSKSDALAALEKVIAQYDLAPTTVGREIAGDPGFVTRMRDPDLTISTKTLDSVWRFILRMQGQLDLDLE